MQVLLSIVMASSASAHPPHTYLALGLIARAVKTNVLPTQVVPSAEIGSDYNWQELAMSSYIFARRI